MNSPWLSAVDDKMDHTGNDSKDIARAPESPSFQLTGAQPARQAFDVFHVTRMTDTRGTTARGL